VESKLLRAKAAKQFEEILVSNFTTLKTHQQNGFALLVEIETAILVTVSEKTSLVANAMNSVHELAKQKPELMNVRQLVTTVVCGGLWGLLLVLPFYIARIVEANFQGPVDSGVLLLFFPVFCLVITVIIIFRFKTHRHELLVWEDGKFAEAVNAFKQLKGKYLHEFKCVEVTYKATNISEAIYKLNSSKIDSSDKENATNPSSDGVEA
jgi:hypothetical protein